MSGVRVAFMPRKAKDGKPVKIRLLTHVRPRKFQTHRLYKPDGSVALAKTLQLDASYRKGDTFLVGEIEVAPSDQGKPWMYSRMMLVTLIPSGAHRIPDGDAHVISVVALDPPRVVGGQHLAVRQLDTARIAAVPLKINHTERVAPGGAVVVAEPDVDTAGIRAVAVGQQHGPISEPSEVSGVLLGGGQSHPMRPAVAVVL